MRSLKNDRRNSESDLTSKCALVNSELSRCLPDYPYQPSDAVAAAAQFSVQSLGHRWRPILFLVICEKLAQVDKVAALKGACAVELIHTASIILDDLMDKATLRRGHAPCYLKFGEHIAISAHDWLCDVADYLIEGAEGSGSNISKASLKNLLRRVKTEMWRGQLMDVSRDRASVEKIIEKSRLKSGVLYGFAASVPARLAGLTDLAEDLQRFGELLGVAYQIGDDIADCVETPEKLGKNVGQDKAKSTIPRLVGLETALQLKELYKNKAIDKLDGFQGEIDDLADLLERICA